MKQPKLFSDVHARTLGIASLLLFVSGLAIAAICATNQVLPGWLGPTIWADSLGTIWRLLVIFQALVVSVLFLKWVAYQDDVESRKATESIDAWSRARYGIRK